MPMRVTRRRIYRAAVQRRDKNSNALSGPSQGASISVDLMAAKQSERGRRFCLYWLSAQAWMSLVGLFNHPPALA